MYSRLLVPLDGSATAELALHHAAALARLSGATLVLLHVIEEMKHCNGFERPQVYVEQVRPGFLAAGQALLDAAAALLDRVEAQSTGAGDGSVDKFGGRRS